MSYEEMALRQIFTKATHSVLSLRDGMGHYAPYVGGGGCYDYDAISLLTSRFSDIPLCNLVSTFKSILSEQNPDGGFCETALVRPRSVSNAYLSLKHILNAPTNSSRIERAKYFVNLQRSKHNRIHTHWTEYSRHWSESDLWDSWFRMLTLARIDIAFNPSHQNDWGFINFPGIGFHESVRD